MCCNYSHINTFFFIIKSRDISRTDQLQHPWTSTAGREATEQPEDDDDGSGPNEDIWYIGALVWIQEEVELQINLSPYSNSQQDDSC